MILIRKNFSIFQFKVKIPFVIYLCFAIVRSFFIELQTFINFLLVI
jgi:hypothetical protein